MLASSLVLLARIFPFAKLVVILSLFLRLLVLFQFPYRRSCFRIAAMFLSKVSRCTSSALSWLLCSPCRCLAILSNRLLTLRAFFRATSAAFRFSLSSWSILAKFSSFWDCKEQDRDDRLLRRDDVDVSSVDCSIDLCEPCFDMDFLVLLW